MNPYFGIINSNVPHERPPNWRSSVLFNGRLNINELPADWPKPQLFDGTLLPEARSLVNALVNSDGSLRNRTGSTFTMQSPVIKD